MDGEAERHLPMPNSDEWPEFVLPWDDGSPGATDMSHLLHKPAGSKGLVRIEDGRLVTGDGERFRIWGQNFSFSASLPPTEMVPKIARRLAKFGINCVRLHLMDKPWPTGVLRRHLPGTPKTTRGLDPEALARLDYFVYCCREEGVYTDINLNVCRPFTEADGVKQAEWLGFAKAVTYFDPRLIELQKEYAQQLLTHVNTFTGNRYADEPAVVLVELLNENSLLESWVSGRLRGEQTEPAGTWCDIPRSYAEDLDRLWNEWLCGRYPNRDAAAIAWGGLDAGEDPEIGTVKRLLPEDFASANKIRFHDEAAFYADIEGDYFREMKTFLRDDLGVKQVIMGTSDHNHSIHGALHVQNNTALGIVDAHCYWQHPRRVKAEPRQPSWFITNTPMLDTPDHSIISQLSRTRVAGMPMIVSEVNEPFPNDYAAEFLPILSAYALLQDWDGIFLYTYSHSMEKIKSGAITGHFDISCNPVMMPQSAVAALTFLRGDVKAAETIIEQRLPGDWLLEGLRSRPDDVYPYAVPKLPGRLALVHRTAVADFDAATLEPDPETIELPIGMIVSDTRELTWVEWENRTRFVATTPNYEAIVARGGERASGHLAVNISTPFFAVQLISLTDAPIATSERMLLVTAARAANTATVWFDDSRTTVGDYWGYGPTRIEPVIGEIKLRDLEDVETIRVTALDAQGQPMGLATAAGCRNGIWVFPVNDDLVTPWWLIELER